MKHLLIAVFSLFHFSIFSQTPKLVVVYNADSTIVGSGVLDNSLQTGLWKYYDVKTNTLLTEGTFSQGFRDGQWTSFHSNGRPKERADYRRGKLFGPATFYDSYGSLVKEMLS